MLENKKASTNVGVELRFGASGAFFLRWLPDETLFSLASRYHRLSAATRAEETCRVLFGRSRGGLAHDLPDSIDDFIERTKGLLGCEAETLIRQHTILPFYLPFRSASDAEAAIAALREPNIGSLKFQLGMLTSRFRAHHPLKACLACMSEDVASENVAYWHLAHQYPGVWHCAKHNALLLESTVKSTGVARFHWHLPDTGTLVQSITPPLDSTLREKMFCLLAAFAIAATELARMPRAFHFDPERLVRAHCEQMIDRGFAQSSGRLSGHASESLSTFLRPLALVPELSALALPVDRMRSQFAYMRSANRALTHPLRHIGHILWLYGSWAAFVDVYQRPTRTRTVAIGRPVLARAVAPAKVDPRIQAFLALVNRYGIAVTTAARQVGVDPKTGMAWAARAGIAIARRPQKLGSQLQKLLSAALRRGCDKRHAADRFGVSVETVTTTLRTTVGLHDAWKHTRLAERLRAERKTWQGLRQSNPMAGMKALRWMASSTYAWLYRHDRAWLQDQTNFVASARQGNNVGVNWTARDLALSAAVRIAGQELVAESPHLRITLWRLYQRVPALKPKLRYLDRLPNTQTAIAHAIRHQPKPAGTRPLL